uniref:BHLH domain-containing protein n=1 Tax=Panagrellus redivivus TaxID=6233 RepID=A0A7E4W2N5_PANRE
MDIQFRQRRRFTAMTKKPVMEKQRRDRMNRAMDELKAYLLKYDPAHSSKLEKADILERTCELIRRMELERNSPSNRVFIEGYFRGTSDVCVHLKNKSNTPEVQRLINDIMMNLRPPMPPPPQGVPMPTPPMPNTPGGSVAPMPTPPPIINGQMVRPMMPPPPFFMGFPGMPPMQMPMTPIKFPTVPNNDTQIKPEPITPAPKKTESPFCEEDVDVENVDDDTFSNPGSPETPVHARKRKLSSTDDSGISEPSPKRLSPIVASTASSNGAFSIDSLLISKN